MFANVVNIRVQRLKLSIRWVFLCLKHFDRLAIQGRNGYLPNLIFKYGKNHGHKNDH